MRTVVSLLIILYFLHQIEGIPLSPDSALWHKLSKRDTAPVASPSAQDKNGTINPSTQTKTEDKTKGNGDELMETQPDSFLAQSFPTDADVEQSNENDAGSDRSIDWQLLSGNPADLERELESRRRRRSIRSASLSRQHRIRTTGTRAQRSRSKRNAYYDVSPSDLLAAYAYLQARRQDDQVDEAEPQLSLLDDVSDTDLSNLASLIYELQHADDGADNVEDDTDDNDQVLPAGYVEYEPANTYESEIRITPEQLAALEQALSEQQVDDSDDGAVSLYPKDKRSIIEEDEEDEDTDDDVEPAYLIPSDVQPSAQLVQIPLSNAYENPYDFYQIDQDPSAYEEALRRIDEQELRDRIASLIDDINQQREIARRRRR